MKNLLTLLCSLLAAGLSAAGEMPKGATLSAFRLLGDMSHGRALFTLEANGKVAGGETLMLVRGPVALTEPCSSHKWHLEPAENGFQIHFDRAGEVTFKVSFEASVQQSNGWNEVQFNVAAAPLQPIHLRGLPPDTQLELPGAARPKYENSEFVSFLSGDGLVKLRWREARPETEGKLFFAAEMLSQITVGPGLVKQTALLDFKVMQGEVNKVTLLLTGQGEVTRVQGDQVLAWNIEPMPNASERRLVIELNQPQKTRFALQIQTQSSLDAFPQSTDIVRLTPASATRFAGYIRVENAGAVRIEVARAEGLSQVSPDQFPETDLSRAALPASGSQKFVYRFSGPDYALRVQSDQILPEITVSELLGYHLGQNELSVDCDFEADIREAPIRELSFTVPASYGVAQLNAAGMNDYFLGGSGPDGAAELRVVFAQPVTGRQIVRFRLERNGLPPTDSWSLPRISIPKAKSIHGHLAISSDPGFRLVPDRISGLTEIATAFFPRKISGIQSAFRISDPLWQEVVRVERLGQTLQADVLHLFSIGEGVAYGSSVMNYTISGAPISTFNIELSDEYFNLEFIGKDVRNWQKVPGGYRVDLHAPVSGAYTLLATYERPFKRQGDTLTFTGARPLGVQSEQGHTLVTSAYQFQVKPIEVSPGLVSLEAAEVPAEYRLLFDAPLLAAYHYVARPFNLRLALNPLIQGDSLSLVIDRAALKTRVSKEGQILTEAQYFVKNRGNPNLRLTLPAGTHLWSVTINGTPVVPVAEGDSNLIPLPAGRDPNAVLTLDCKLASVSSNPKHMTIAAPIIGAPVMLAEWRLGGDIGQKLNYLNGSLKPAGGQADPSGFAQITKAFSTGTLMNPALVVAGLVLLSAAFVGFRWGAGAAARWNSRHVFGTGSGAAALILAAFVFNNLIGRFEIPASGSSNELSFVAPVQQAGSALTVELRNLGASASSVRALISAWPALVAAALWFIAWTREKRVFKAIFLCAGWWVLAWMSLKMPSGAPIFVWLLQIFVLIHVFVPLFLRITQVPSSHPMQVARAAPGAALIILAAAIFGLSEPDAPASGIVKTTAPGLPEVSEQVVRVDKGFVFGTLKIHWNAQKGQSFPLLFEPAVLTDASYPEDSLKVQRHSVALGTERPAGTNRVCSHQLVAKRSGTFDVKVHYQLALAGDDAESGFVLPTAAALVNKVNLVLTDREADVISAQAVSVHSKMDGSNTLAELVLSPAGPVRIDWKPRTRDLRHEKTVVYAEFAQLFIPTTGIIESEHSVMIRVAQGEVSDLEFDVPSGMTITEVLDARTEQEKAGDKSRSRSFVSRWRFDPDARTLRVNLASAQARPFALLIKSQVAAGPLPFQRELGLIRLRGAAEQTGLVGVATPEDIQLVSLEARSLSSINLEDFPSDLLTANQSRTNGLGLRKAFRYLRPEDTFVLNAAAVEPDIRVASQDTLSLGEDRTVLAVNATVQITRAGIFRLSFSLPSGFDVESVSGTALTHWTEAVTDTNRLITLHLNGKTEGQQQFAINLVGPGSRATNGWLAPQLILREANKQTGTVLIVPEQGFRIQTAASEGLVALDPQASGIKQKGVLAFRVLQKGPVLLLNIERVNAWIQVNSLQQASVAEAQLKVSANLQYQIENAGLRSLRVFLPTNAENVRFQGEQISDYLPLPGTVTNELQLWDIKLQRRVIGAVLLQVSYQVQLPGAATALSLRGVQAAEVNMQRGFVTVCSVGRVQLRVDSAPAALQSAEWQSIPRALQQGFQASTANFTYRLVDADFVLPLQVEHHQPAQVLAARINNINFQSVLSDDGVMLTRVNIEMSPGSKRLLRFTLPQGARFWFAFVDQNGVWPWREQDQVLIPLDQHSAGAQLVAVEIFYADKVGRANRNSLNLQLLAPQFDLPLENITWRVSMSDKWELAKWSGSLQLESEEVMARGTTLDLEDYLHNETLQLEKRTKTAESLLASANSALAQGDPQQARRAFQSAYGLSTHDAAFNEDARVQLHNVKLQEALVALNMRQSVASGDSGVLGAKLRELRDRNLASYSQQDAKDIIEHNSADQNTAFMKLAERLVQQQDAAASVPAALHASIPEQGRVLTFKRAVLVDPWAQLRLDVKTNAQATAGWAICGLILAGIFGLMAAILGIRRIGMEAASGQPA